MKIRKLILSLVLSVGLLSPVIAQDGMTGRKESTSGAVIKGRAPVNQEILRVRFPKPKETKLKNGVTVLVMEDHRLPQVTFQVQIRHGSMSEPVELPGLAGMTAELLKEGAGRYNSLEIAQQLDRMGASFYADAPFSTDVTNAGIVGLAEHTDGMVDQLADLLLRPTFPQEELEKYRARQLANLARLRSQPGFLASERFLASLYPGHPGSVTAPTEESLQKVTREHLVDFHKRFFLPGSTILAVSGDVRSQEIVAKLEKAFGAWTPVRALEVKMPPVMEAETTKIYIVDRPGSVQTKLVMGNVGLTRTDPDHVVVAVMNYIFGSESSSRLFMKLREEKGLTYGAYSSFRLDSWRAPWSASGDVRTEVTEQALRAFIGEMERIRTEPVSDAELEAARRALVARFALSLERASSLTARAIEIKRFGLPEDYWDRYPQMVEKVTKEDILRVAKKYLDPDRMQIVAVGDAAKIREALQSFGEVTLYGVDGKPLAP